MIRLYPLASFVILAYLLSWFIWLPLYLPYLGIHQLPVLPYHHAWGALGPFLAAFIITYAQKGYAGMKDLVHRMVKWEVNPVWLLVALLGPFILFIIASLLVYLQNSYFPDLARFGLSAEFPEFGWLTFFLYNLFSFGYGEETGWRGFALPRIQNKHNALMASVLLGIIWAGWHVPLFLYRPGYTSMDIAGITGWVMSLMTGSILLTWLYNSSNGSILIVSIFHATIDIAFTSRAVTENSMMYMGMLITFWAIIVIFVAKPAALSRGRKQIQLQPDSFL